MTYLRRNLTTLAFVLGLLFWSSCGREMPIEPLTNEEIADIIEVAMSEAAGGLTQQLVNMTEELQNLTLEDFCDSTFSDSVAYANTRAGREASYTSAWTLDLTCNNFNIPQTGLAANNAQVTVDGPRLVSDGTASLSSTVAGLQPTATAVTWDGTYQRVGNQTLGINQDKSVSSTLDVSYVAITIDKSSYEVSSGTADFILDATVDGNPHTYTGSITYNGDDTITITINGDTYTVPLN
jgi:hypothetical protein